MTVTQGLRVVYLFLLNIEMIIRGVNNKYNNFHQLLLGNWFL